MGWIAAGRLEHGGGARDRVVGHTNAQPVRRGGVRLVTKGIVLDPEWQEGGRDLDGRRDNIEAMLTQFAMRVWVVR